MAKKYKAIPAVSFELLMKGHLAVNEDHERFGSAEPTVSIVRALHKTHGADQISAVAYRLGTLAKVIQEGIRNAASIVDLPALFGPTKILKCRNGRRKLLNALKWKKSTRTNLAASLTVRP
jgi:hypothetical protein